MYLSPQGSEAGSPQGDGAVEGELRDLAVRPVRRRSTSGCSARRVDEEVSIGDFVLSGGELAAMALIDAVVRQLPGALGDEQLGAGGVVRRRAARLPAVHAAGGVRRASRVPEVLLSGHHENIRRWRLKQALGRTWLRRPDLLAAQDAERRGKEAAGGIPAGAQEPNMNLIQKLEQEEIQRLKQDDPRLLARATRWSSTSTWSRASASA